jgi:hypothetical protein
MGDDQQGGRDSAGGEPVDSEARSAGEIERRLDADEERLARDERRLTQDEVRLGVDEQQIRRNWRLAIVLGVLLALTIAALVIGIVALNRDIEAVAKAEPKDDSVGTAALQTAAVTSAKLADGAVTHPKIASGAVGGNNLAAGAVGSKQVAQNSLTGGNINEATLGTVPQASKAADAASLGGIAAAGYLSGRTAVQASSGTGAQSPKGPVKATCPSGTVVVGGGVVIEGTSIGVGITASAPQGGTSWVGSAAATDTPAPWRIVVTAICARGG